MANGTPTTRTRIPGNALVVYEGQTYRLAHDITVIKSRVPASMAALSTRELRVESERREKESHS